MNIKGNMFATDRYCFFPLTNKQMTNVDVLSQSVIKYSCPMLHLNQPVPSPKTIVPACMPSAEWKHSHQEIRTFVAFMKICTSCSIPCADCSAACFSTSSAMYEIGHNHNEMAPTYLFPAGQLQSSPQRRNSLSISRTCFRARQYSDR
jgi:hypothetical protein